MITTIKVIQALIIILGAPLVRGIIAQFKARLQRRQGASIWRPYADLASAGLLTNDISARMDGILAPISTMNGAFLTPRLRRPRFASPL